MIIAIPHVSSMAVRIGASDAATSSWGEDVNMEEYWRMWDPLDGSDIGGYQIGERLIG